jgi:hypothetical protein
MPLYDQEHLHNLLLESQALGERIARQREEIAVRRRELWERIDRLRQRGHPISVPGYPRWIDLSPLLPDPRLPGAQAADEAGSAAAGERPGGSGACEVAGRDAAHPSPID